MISYKYIIAYINRFFKNGDILYTAPSYNEIFEYFNYLIDHVYVDNNDLCVYNVYEKKITKAYKDGLYSIYNKNDVLLAICDEEFLLSNELRPLYKIYDYNGNDVIKLIFKKKTDLNKVRAEEALIKTEREKNKCSFSIEIDKYDSLPELEQVKCLELAFVTLRENYPNIKIDIGDRYKNVRYTVRRSFEDREKDYYTDLETAKSSCPFGYSVFDVLTEECIMTNTEVKDRISEGMKYKKAWEELKTSIQKEKEKIDSYDKEKDILASYNLSDLMLLSTFKKVSKMIQTIEGEIINNE